jgi:hypothetical protein
LINKITYRIGRINLKNSIPINVSRSHTSEKCATSIKKLAAGLQIRVSGPYVYRPSIHAVTFQILWDILHAVTV